MIDGAVEERADAMLRLSIGLDHSGNDFTH
jgi:hypothetical protein